MNALASSGILQPALEPRQQSIAKKATVNATPGEATMAITAVRTTPQLIAARPPAASPAPTSPPMIAWLDEDGMPMYQVT